MIPLRRLLVALALLATLAAAAAQAPDAAIPVPRLAPDLTPRALDADELDAVTLARMALRFELDGVALEVLRRSGAPGLILGVVVDGQTVFAEAYGSAEIGGRPLTLDAPLWLGALGEPLTAVGVLRLAAAGVLDVDDAAADWLPDGALGPPADPAHRPVSLRDLLTHTAGLDVRTPRTTGDRLPPRVAAPGARLAACGACYDALADVLRRATDQSPAAAFRTLVFEPLGFAHATASADAGAAYDAATVSPHAVGDAGVTALAAPRPSHVEATGVRASALDVLRFAEALTHPLTPAALAGGVREGLLTPAVRPHPALPGWTLGLAESAVLGHPVVQRDGDLPGLRASLVVVPRAGVAVFTYLNGGAIDDGLEAASGVRDARAVLVEEVVRRLVGDARVAEAPAAGWPPATDGGPSVRPGSYRRDRVARTGPERALGAADPIFHVAVAGGALTLTPPAGGAAPATYHPDAAGTWRRVGDGAPLVAVERPGEPPRILVHLGATAGLTRVGWLERPGVVAGSLGAALAAALAVIVAWPVGALLRWRRREPVGAALPRAVVGVRAWARLGALFALAIVAALVALAWTARTTAAAPIASATPPLQIAALLLALATVGLALRTLTAWASHPQLGWRWVWHGLVVVAFVALLAQGWTWGLWSPEALAATWPRVTS